MANDQDTTSPTKAKGVAPDENVKFLISCIKYAQNGKINFEDVAQECDIVSKGAAAKRYERLLKAHGVNPADIRSAGEAKNSNSPKKKTPKSKATQTEENDNGEDDEDVPPESPSKAKKQRTPAAKKNGAKKRKLDDDKLADKETEDIKMEDEEAEPEV